MPIAPCTMFMDLGGLEVRYRASAEPQRLEVGMTFKRKGVDSIARVSMRNLVEAIVGALPPGDDALSVDTSKMIAWLDDFGALVSHWVSTRTTMPNAAHKKGLTGAADIVPKLTRDKRTVTVKWKAFDHDPGPPFDVLTNMLGKFHGTVSPIVSVEYAHP